MVDDDRDEFSTSSPAKTATPNSRVVGQSSRSGEPLFVPESTGRWRSKSGRRVSRVGRQSVLDAIDPKAATEAPYGLSALRLRRANHPRNRHQSGSNSERGEV